MRFCLVNQKFHALLFWRQEKPRVTTLQDEQTTHTLSSRGNSRSLEHSKGRRRRDQRSYLAGISQEALSVISNSSDWHIPVICDDPTGPDNVGDSAFPSWLSARPPTSTPVDATASPAYTNSITAPSGDQPLYVFCQTYRIGPVHPRLSWIRSCVGKRHQVPCLLHNACCPTW